MKIVCIESGLISVAAPFLLFVFSAFIARSLSGFDRIFRPFVLISYIFMILYFTVFRMQHSDPPYIDLTPFWSYGRIDQADVRWQVYMNVFLFIPFGFILPWSAKKLQVLWKTAATAALFSVLTELTQFVFRIGLCETDDVIHNTLGALIGYGYWRLLYRVQKQVRGEG